MWRRLLSAISLALALCLLGSCKSTLLDERFFDPSLRNWTVIDDPDTVEGPSLWQVEKDGWLHQRSNIWGRRGDFLDRWYGTLIVAGDESWSDYLMSVRARAEDGDGFGAVFRFQDAEHFYRLIFINDGFNGGPVTRLDRRDGADYTELWKIERGFRRGAEMLIEIEAVGDLIRVKVDQHILCEVRDGKYPRGKVGLFCYAQNGQSFDEVRVVEQ